MKAHDLAPRPPRPPADSPLADLASVTARLGAWRPAAAHVDTPRAAVAAILRQGPASVDVLFIKRAAREGDPWSGDIAFPGGKREPADPSLLATAVRETAEEVGLTLGPSSFVTRLDDIVAGRNGFRVAGFAFAIDHAGDDLTPNAEVAAVLWTPLATLTAPEHKSRISIEHEGHFFEFPSIRLGDDVLWGMTYRLVRSLIAIALDRSGASGAA